MLRIYLAMLVFLFLSASMVLAEIIYVDADAMGINDGTTWADAYKFLQDALTDANSASKPVEIRVAHGIYRPDRSTSEPEGTGDRTATFQLISGVVLRGGYAGFGKADPNSRDVEAYESILSGDLICNDVDINDPCELQNESTRDDNSYHVVTGTGTDETTVLDSFTITGGNANCDWPAYFGGGIYIYSGSPILLNCTLSCNVAVQAGGLYISSGSPKLTNCTFISNSAMYAGGMLNNGTDTTLTNCTFIDNFATISGGGTICSNAKLSDCNFIRNTAGVYGGAIKNDCWAPALNNCVFEENKAGSDGGGIYNYEGDLQIKYCKFIGNSAVYGGAIYQGDTDTVLTGCWFIENLASIGGAVANDGYSDPILTNCIFSGNSAVIGAGFYNTTGSAPKFENCTFCQNSAMDVGGGICITNNYDYNPILLNSIFWANTDSTGTGQHGQINYEDGIPIVNFCLIQGWNGELGGTGNIDIDPCFADLNSDYHLKSQAGRWDPNERRWIKDDFTSPCIDAGDPMSPIGQEPFPNGGIINMGAYGGTVEASKSYFNDSVCEIVVAGDINGDCKVDFADFALMAFHWLEYNYQ